MTEMTTAPSSPPETWICDLCGVPGPEMICDRCQHDAAVLMAPTLRARLVAMWRHPEVRADLRSGGVLTAAAVVAAAVSLTAQRIWPEVPDVVWIAAVMTLAAAGAAVIWWRGRR